MPNIYIQDQQKNQLEKQALHHKVASKCGFHIEIRFDLKRAWCMNNGTQSIISSVKVFSPDHVHSRKNHAQLAVKSTRHC